MAVNLQKLGAHYQVSIIKENEPCLGGRLSWYEASEPATRPSACYYQQYTFKSSSQANELFNNAHLLSDGCSEADRLPEHPRVRWFLQRSSAVNRDAYIAQMAPDVSELAKTPIGQFLMQCQGTAIAIWQTDNVLHKIAVTHYAGSNSPEELKRNLEHCKLLALRLLCAR